MITSNPLSHLHPKDRIRQLALEVQTVPGWGLNDKAFHASLLANRAYFVLNAIIHQAIKAFYLNQGHTAAEWQIVSDDPRKFNRVWCQSLGLLPDDLPPPKHLRSVLPSQSFN